MSVYYTADGQAVDVAAGTTQAAGSTQKKTFVGQRTSYPPNTFPWGTVWVIGGLLAAGGAAVWEIEAHRQVRAVKG